MRKVDNATECIMNGFLRQRPVVCVHRYICADGLKQWRSKTGIGKTLRERAACRSRVGGRYRKGNNNLQYNNNNTKWNGPRRRTLERGWKSNTLRVLKEGVIHTHMYTLSVHRLLLYRTCPLFPFLFFPIHFFSTFFLSLLLRSLEYMSPSAAVRC